VVVVAVEPVAVVDAVEELLVGPSLLLLRQLLLLVQIEGARRRVLDDLALLGAGPGRDLPLAIDQS